MELEKSVQTYLKSGSWLGDTARNPVILERGVTYVRYDSIRIGNLKDSAGGVQIAYLWQGLIVGWTRVEGASLAGDRHHHAGTAEGRIVITGTPGR